MTLTDPQIAALLQPYLAGASVPPTLYTQLGLYLDLLLRWNARTNLTAIRDPEEIVRRHFGESLFAGINLAPRLPAASTLLDFGSGAGFPGLPIQLLLPEVQVTLGESQGKKASFLREAVRTLNLKTEVWPKRVEEMPSDRRFDAVTMRAVDKMDDAITAAGPRVELGGILAILAGQAIVAALPDAECLAVPSSKESFLYISRR